MSARRIAAQWVLPIEGAPIGRGAILIGPDGRITAVGPAATVPHPPDVPAEEFPEAIALPGLVNTHTHLELTGLEDRVPERSFTAWIRRLRQVKAERTRDEFLAAARRGILDCWAAGITTIADTGDSGTVIEALADAGGSGIVYQEVFGAHPADRDASLAGLQDRVSELSRFTRERIRLGVSPHAPYTVSGTLYEAVARYACAEQLPLAVHIAESHAETELLATGTGAFADMWQARGMPLPTPLGCTPVEWLDRHGVLGPATLCIHAVQVGPADIARLTHAGAAIAHCPVSNAAHGHGAAPLSAMLAAGLRVGLGTDSVVSVGKLDLFAEARVAQTLASLSTAAALELCTLGGARALGLDHEIGSFVTGKWGDCVIVESDEVVATYLAGKAVFRRP